MTSNKANKWPRDWLAWLLVFTAFYAVICLVNLAVDVGRPFPGFVTYYNFPLGRIEIIWNVPAWWWFKDQNGPTITDKIISVEGVPFTNLAAPINEQTLYEKLKAEGIQSLTVQIQRDNKMLSLNMPIRTFSWRHYIEFALGPLILSSSLLLLAAILYLASGTVLVQRIAIMILAAIAALTYSNTSIFLYGQFSDHFLGYSNPINALAALILGPLLIHFAFYYPTPIFQNNRFLSKIPVTVYGLVIIPFGSYILSRLLINIQGFSPQVKLLDHFFLESVFYFLLFGIGVALLRMVSDSFFRGVHPRSSREARIILVAFLCALPAFWFAAYGAVGTSGSIANMRSLADPRYFVLAVPLALATITLRHYPNQSLNNWLLFVWTLTTSSILANIILSHYEKGFQTN